MAEILKFDPRRGRLVSRQADRARRAMIASTRRWCIRLGAVTGVGHARLILERFGKFWGAFSVIDLFLLNALTIVTEFIGISLALRISGPAQDNGRRRRGGARSWPRPAPATSAASSVFRWCLVVRQPAAGAAVFHGASAAWRRLRTTSSCRRCRTAPKPGRRDAADDRHRRHDGRALAALLPAELCHRQAHHAALHPL